MFRDGVLVDYLLDFRKKFPSELKRILARSVGVLPGLGISRMTAVLNCLVKYPLAREALKRLVIEDMVSSGKARKT